MDTFRVGTGRTQLTFAWQRRGRDVYVHISGGADHVGAVALAGPAADGGILVQTLCLPPHREDEIVRTVARQLSRQCGGTVCVTAGIHLDRITRPEIDAIRTACEVGVDRLCQRLRSSD